MIKKVIIGVVVAIVLFLGYVSTRDGKFTYERNGMIAASAKKIFPYISDLKKGSEWSPFAKLDPNMQTEFGGPDAQVGSTLVFKGNSEAGSGKLEILKIVPDEFVEMKLTMTAPFHAENIVQYKLTAEGSGTRFSWSMSGDGGFIGKLLPLFIDCEKMVADQFVVGINNLKTLIESQNLAKSKK